MFLNCRNRYNRIVIKNTYYGRQNNHTCSSKIFDSDKLCDEPTPDTIKRKVDLMCSGEHKCKVPVSPAFLEKKGNYICPQVRKYLLVTYACHQHPKLHMVCKNCSSKCWPLCQKQCCEPPPPVVPTVKKAPEKITCQEGCPNHCAPQCDMACCASNVLGVVPDNSKHEIVSSCKGDCVNLCAPLCLPSCCSRHKKSATKSASKPSRRLNYKLPLRQVAAMGATCPIGCPVTCRPACQMSCCRPGPTPAPAPAQMPESLPEPGPLPVVGRPHHWVEPFSASHPDYVEPLSARLQRLQGPSYTTPLSVTLQGGCANGCHSTCAPLCSPQCCAYMGELRTLGAPPPPAVPAPAPAPVQAPPQLPVPAAVPAMPQAAVQAPVSTVSQAPALPPAPAPAQAPLPPFASQAAVARTAYAAMAMAQQPSYVNQLAAQLAATGPRVPQPPATLVTGQTLEVEEPNHTFQQIYPENPATRGCPPQCATTCDSSCSLGCCTNSAPPNSYVFTTNPVEDDEQRRTYEKLLEKYRSEQLAKYYQNKAFTQYPPHIPMN